ncbi:MAG: hypothetical protein OSJ53_16405 [Kineothrix sp.]|nr:hypothetical protein C807_03774 [Lachnospiraceae bacterium 28-4]MCI8845731.1 hypothetical protein [Lachnospiraceae bacterium]MCX4345453.1 hypothetical protein [Kineothrix sp.]
MAMQINGNYDHSGTDYAERVKEKQAVERAAKEAERAAEGRGSGKLSELQDEYISSEKSGKKPTGLYRVGQDENGSRKIFFDDPKAACADGKENLRSTHLNEEKERSGEGEDGKEPKISGNGEGKPAEKCVANTDKVDREIKRLKEKKQQLEQQIRSASGDEKKVRELEKKLAQVENELRQKDNDTYRRQNASVSG